MINHNAFRIFIFLFINSYSFVHANNYELDKHRHSSDLEGAFFIVNDSIESSKLITKEFIYDAPESGKVSFAGFQKIFLMKNCLDGTQGLKCIKILFVNQCKKIILDNLGFL